LPFAGFAAFALAGTAFVLVPLAIVVRLLIAVMGRTESRRC